MVEMWYVVTIPLLLSSGVNLWNFRVKRESQV